MNRKSLPALVALNMVLLLALVMVTLTPDRAVAQAPFGQASYVMIAGEVTGQRNMNAVYIIQLNTAKMAAVMYNGGNKKFEIIAGRTLADDWKLPAGTQRGGGR